MFILLLGLLLVPCNGRILQIRVLFSVQYQSLAGSIIVEPLFIFVVYIETQDQALGIRCQNDLELHLFLFADDIVLLTSLTSNIEMEHLQCEILDYEMGFCYREKGSVFVSSQGMNVSQSLQSRAYWDAGKEEDKIVGKALGLSV